MDSAADQWAMVGTLSEASRRAVYEAVCERQDPASREEVAGAVGISRSLAAFHLDKLVEAGLLEADAGPRGGRRLSKIGRPPKRYRRSSRQVNLTVPTRRYELAGRILAAALTAAEHGDPPVETGRQIAYSEGCALGVAAAPNSAGSALDRPLDGLAELLRTLGYAPAPARDGDSLTLANCPFHAIVEVAPELTCRLNLALIDGLLAGLGVDTDVTAALRPQPDACCVVLTRAEVRSA